MGYKREPKVYNLVFEEPEEFKGLEVKLRSLSTGRFLEVMEQQQKADVDVAAATDLVKTLAESLISWNLEDEDDNPIPPTLESLKAQDIDFSLFLVEQWTSAIGGVPGPLDGGSTIGEIPMEPL